MEKTFEKSKLVSMSIKPSILKELDDLALKWGTSRSGIVSVLIKLNELDKYDSNSTLKDLNIKKKNVDWEDRFKNQR